MLGMRGVGMQGPQFFSLRQHIDGADLAINPAAAKVLGRDTEICDRRCSCGVYVEGHQTIARRGSH
jgi:hypothetical protein